MATRNFHIAMHLAGIEIHLPDAPPTQPNMVMMAGMPPQTGDPVQMRWEGLNIAAGSSGGGSGGGAVLPQATEPNQILVSGSDAAYSWGTGDLDEGNYVGVP